MLLVYDLDLAFHKLHEIFWTSLKWSNMVPCKKGLSCCLQYLKLDFFAAFLLLNYLNWQRCDPVVSAVNTLK